MNSPIYIDINECVETNPKCAFRCQNTVGSFRCTCPKGYELAADGLHCIGIKPEYEIKLK
jgi:hypothetical protein